MSYTRVVTGWSREHTGTRLYIGRKRGAMHFGNPFGTKAGLCDQIVADRDTAILAFYQWLTGQAHADVDPHRRDWILARLPTLRGRVLECFCAPKMCHGHVYLLLLDEIPLSVVFPHGAEQEAISKLVREARA